jgi:hypothetical protein
VAVTGWAWPALIVTSVLAGLVAATYVRTGAPTAPDDVSRAGLVGGFLTYLAVGCPVCNKIALLALGYTGALQWFAPVQPFRRCRHRTARLRPAAPPRGRALLPDAGPRPGRMSIPTTDLLDALLEDAAVTLGRLAGGAAVCTFSRAGVPVPGINCRGVGALTVQQASRPPWRHVSNHLVAGERNSSPRSLVPRVRLIILGKVDAWAS